MADEPERCRLGVQRRGTQLLNFLLADTIHPHQLLSAEYKRVLHGNIDQGDSAAVGAEERPKRGSPTDRIPAIWRGNMEPIQSDRANKFADPDLKIGVV